MTGGLFAGMDWSVLQSQIAGRVIFDLINIFRFDDQGRLLEEWVRTDYRSFLRQLGAEER